jgi:hypothetical protein
MLETAAFASFENQDFTSRATAGQNTPTRNPAAAANTVCISSPVFN